ncbi:MAG: hypothetical protein R6U98_19750 [Pirellulaceae bacterium]
MESCPRQAVLPLVGLAAHTQSSATGAFTWLCHGLLHTLYLLDGA